MSFSWYTLYIYWKIRKNTDLDIHLRKKYSICVPYILWFRNNTLFAMYSGCASLATFISNLRCLSASACEGQESPTNHCCDYQSWRSVHTFQWHPNSCSWSSNTLSPWKNRIYINPFSSALHSAKITIFFNGTGSLSGFLLAFLFLARFLLAMPALLLCLLSASAMWHWALEIP